MKKLIRLAAFLALVSGLLVSVSAQQQLDPNRPKNQALESNKVKLEKFEANPATAAWDATETTLTLVGKNISSAPLAIPWAIYDGHGFTPWQRGTEANVPSQGTFTKTFTYPLAAVQPGGFILLMGRVDPGENLDLLLTDRADNSKEIRVTRQDVPKRQLALDGELARQAGAVFDVNPEKDKFGNNVLCDCGTRRWYMGSDSSMSLHSAIPSAYFRFVCAGATGGKAEPEAFKSFRLKNGYKIVRVNWNETRSGGSGGYTAQITPSIGSDNPYTKFSAWTDRGGNYEVWLEIMVEGPVNKDPYR